MGAIGQVLGAVIGAPLKALGLSPDAPGVEQVEDPELALEREAEEASVASDRQRRAIASRSAASGRASTILTGAGAPSSGALQTGSSILFGGP